VRQVFATSLTRRADSQTGHVFDNAHHHDGDCAAENLVEGRNVMDITGKTALVTGANRGLGRELAVQLRDRGAHVYAAARDPQAVDLAGVTPLALDITDPASVAAASRAASGVAILVNNAGSSTGSSLLTGDLAAIRREMETHFFGTLAVTRAFAPQLATHGSSAVLNILSVLSWLSIPRSGAYSAAKSAEWSMTNALRLELAAQGTRVTALHVGYMDTDMTRHLDVPKSDPAAIAKLAIDGIQAGDAEIIADEISGRILAGLSAGVAGLYPQVA
jgi:NAD(P)-dependent dehydrogenase (short-subunit alcohol dehydrogenase family)